MNVKLPSAKVWALQLEGAWQDDSNNTQQPKEIFKLAFFIVDEALSRFILIFVKGIWLETHV